jgi:predicted nucleotidyltransferase
MIRNNLEYISLFIITNKLLIDKGEVNYKDGGEFMSCIIKTCIGNFQLSTLLKEVKNDIFSLLNDSVKQLKLYGSYARGDYNNDSDIDIFLVYDETNLKNIDDLISEISVEYQLKYGIMVNIHDMSISYYNKYKDISPLIKNIEREGVEI